MKTFKDLKVGDLIFEVDHRDKIANIGRIRNISQPQLYDGNLIIFVFNVIVGRATVAVTAVHKKNLDKYYCTEFEGDITVFSNESDFLNYLINESI